MPAKRTFGSYVRKLREAKKVIDPRFTLYSGDIV